MTLHSARFNQCYHSRRGAWTESRHVFLEAGFEHALNRRAPGRPLRILELGLGTGTNALMTMTQWQALNPEGQLHYTAIEPHPLLPEEWSGLGLEALGDPALLAALHASPDAEEHSIQWMSNIQFDRHLDTWQNWASHPGRLGQFDLIFYDAFAPSSQPELWSQARFREAFRLLRETGILVTYCAKGDVRRAMQEAGFDVERLPGPPGKREMLRAERPAWSEMDIRRFNVRVYFFLLDAPSLEGVSLEDLSRCPLLLSDEKLSGEDCTKLPGGGLEFGEGPMACAQREAMEELGQAIKLGPLIHATGGFVRSAWRGEEQVLCHYYLATLQEPPQFRVTSQRFDYAPSIRESFRWKALSDVREEDLSFDVDKEALQALKRRLKEGVSLS